MGSHVHFSIQEALAIVHRKVQPDFSFFLFGGLLVSILGVCSAGQSAAGNCYPGDIQRYFADDESPK